LVGACSAPTRLPAWLPSRDTDPALDAFRRGDVPNALRTYRERTRAGGSPVARYNLGTALAASDSLAAARGPLDDARRVREPALRFRALFNLGAVHLRRGLAVANGDANAGGQAPDTTATSGSNDDRQELDAALAVYREALLLQPGSIDAKWNYELALRKRQGGGGGGGGGGGQGTPPPEAPPEPQPAGGVDRRQAEQLLNAAAREERQTQGQAATPLAAAPAGRQGLVNRTARAAAALWCCGERGRRSRSARPRQRPSRARRTRRSRWP
jgi:tetratricopeptide (TPR) repeat protein